MKAAGSLGAVLLAIAVPVAAAFPGAAPPVAAASPVDPPAAGAAARPPREAWRGAADRAAAFLASDQCQDPFGYLLCDFLYRRFGVQALASSTRRFDDFRSAHPEAAWADVFRRLIDPAQKAQRGWLDDAPGGVRGLDRVTALALYCDQVPLPAGYRALLWKARSEGGYSLTHAALALAWLRENGCQAVDRDFERQVIRETAALVKADAVVSDLELEAAAIVAHLGDAALLPDRFLDEVLAAQQPGGGWAEDGGSASPAAWHPTVLALWYLLEVERPGRREPMVPRSGARDAGARHGLRIDPQVPLPAGVPRAHEVVEDR